MADENKVDQVETQGTLVNDTAKKNEIDIEQVKKELSESIRKEIELEKKNEISGLNRKIGETEKQLKLRLTAEEQATEERERERRELLQEFSDMAGKSLGLDGKHSALIKGSNKDEIKENAEMLKSFKEFVEEPHVKQIKTLEATIKAQEEEIKILKASGAVPKKGDGTDGKVISRADFDKMTDINKASFMKSGGIIED